MLQEKLKIEEHMRKSADDRVSEKTKELLQAYADDVEGRSPRSGSFSSGNPDGPTRHATRSSEEVHSEASSARNSDGMHSFTDTSSWSKKEEGLVSSAWRKLRGFIGF